MTVNLRVIVAYFTEESLDRLKSVDDFPRLVSLSVPHGKYKSARSGKCRPDHILNNDFDSLHFPRLEYVPYTPRRTESPPSSRLPQSPHQPAQQLPLIQIDTRLRTKNSMLDPRGPGSASDETPDLLAPLAYLENIPPPRRHPMDEKILKLLSPARLL